MISRPRSWLIVTGLTLLASLGTIVLSPPELGIDFTGGTLLEVQSSATPTQVRSVLRDSLGLDSTVQPTQEGTLLIRTRPLSREEHDATVAALRDAEALTEELRYESIGPTIGNELRRNAWIAISATIVALVAYLAYVFRDAGGLVKPWKFGLAATGALIHDVLVVTALFGLLGQFTGATIDSLFVTALMAILGYSVNDTIVLFNRFRDEWLTTRTASLPTVMDRAARATLVRSLNTSITTLLVLITMFVAGGATIRWFVVALAAGTVAGTYSSIFVAPALLYALARKRS